MNTGRGLATGLIAAWAGLAPVGAAESPRDLFEQMLPPELVLAQAESIGLDAKQREAVHRVQAEHQPKMPPLLRQMREARDLLVALLGVDTPDEAAVLAQFEKLNAIETELKRVRLQMAVGVKKVLTPAQQDRALALQGQRLAEAPTGTDTLAAKLQRVKDGLEQWKREGRDVTPLRERWDRFRAAEDKGHYRQARQALDEAITLLESPPARQ